MSTAPAALVRRARILLLAADGASNTRIAARLGCSRPTVIKWRERYENAGIGALVDLPRSGRPGSVDEVEVLVATLAADGRPPDHLGVDHWSSRVLGGELGVSFSAVAKVWRKWGVRPHRGETFTFPTEPELEARIRDVVGLYVAPSEKAVVVCVDEAGVEEAGADEAGGGTSGMKGTGGYGSCVAACGEQLAGSGMPAFVEQVAKAHPRMRLHVVVDGHVLHRHREAGARPAKNPRVTLHSTPTSCSWLRIAEIFLGLAAQQAVRRGAVPDYLPDLEAAVRGFIDGRGTRCEPFTWIRSD
ncbi:helix-turn-helix domain-containing protein [Streptomyces sp. NPDC051320]|uniref:helix-turn-helix domain-containing protein n=1 Tax=Streptomyces sp. NPDC051320 TaxID=3154644 RepID=UPI003446BF24